MAQPTMVACSICGQEVNKRTTYHVGDGKRACRAHEGVTDAKNKLQADVVKAREAEANKIARRHEAADRRAQDCVIPRKPFCWICRKTGIQERDYWFKLLTYNEIQELKGKKVNIFNPGPEYAKGLREHCGLADGEVVVRLLPVDLNKAFMPKFKNISYNGYCAAGLGQIIATCQDCMDKYQLKAEEIKMPSLDQMLLIGVISKPAIQDAAFKELMK